MTLTINGVTIGTIRAPKVQGGGMGVDPCESPFVSGGVGMQPYKTHTKPRTFRLDVNVVSATYHDVVQALGDLCDTEPCLYLQDDATPLYGSVMACWCLVDWTSELIYDGTTKVGHITLDCMVTTDYADSTYTPT
jgi:hypothetical protein